jgi:hypothetical protein
MTTASKERVFYVPYNVRLPVAAAELLDVKALAAHVRPGRYIADLVLGDLGQLPKNPQLTIDDALAAVPAVRPPSLGAVKPSAPLARRMSPRRGKKGKKAPRRVKGKK